MITHKHTRRTVEVLVSLGVAAEPGGALEVVRYPIQAAARKVSGEQDLASAVASIVRKSEEYARLIENQVQSDFEPFSSELERLRVANAPHKRIRATDDAARAGEG